MKALTEFMQAVIDDLRQLEKRTGKSEEAITSLYSHTLSNAGKSGEILDMVGASRDIFEMMFQKILKVEERVEDLEKITTALICDDEYREKAQKEVIIEAMLQKADIKGQLMLMGIDSNIVDSFLDI